MKRALALLLLFSTAARAEEPTPDIDLADGLTGAEWSAAADVLARHARAVALDHRDAGYRRRIAGTVLVVLGAIATAVAVYAGLDLISDDCLGCVVLGVSAAFAAVELAAGFPLVGVGLHDELQAERDLRLLDGTARFALGWAFRFQ